MNVIRGSGPRVGYPDLEVGGVYLLLLLRHVRVPPVGGNGRPLGYVKPLGTDVDVRRPLVSRRVLFSDRTSSASSTSTCGSRDAVYRVVHHGVMLLLLLDIRVLIHVRVRMGIAAHSGSSSRGFPAFGTPVIRRRPLLGLLDRHPLRHVARDYGALVTDWRLVIGWRSSSVLRDVSLLLLSTSCWIV